MYSFKVYARIFILVSVSDDNSQAADGTFMEEPGAGAVATIGNKKVSVGTLEWVQRY